MPATASSYRLLLATFVAAIFVSAALLFAVQPLFAKMVLPRLGGTPAVWSVAMVFFQAMLLAGYAYAHALTRFLPGRSSVVVHLVVMIVAIFALPLGIAAGWGRAPTQSQEFWLLGLFARLDRVAVLRACRRTVRCCRPGSRAPDIRRRRIPYFLYAASNIGSFLALLAYPFVIEPFSHLPQQTIGWTCGFYLLIALIAALRGVAAALAQCRCRISRPMTARHRPARDALIWIALAAVPSALLIAITAHISTDVAAAPFLWVVPLALYLATFVIAFQSRPILPHRLVTFIAPGAVILLVDLAGARFGRPDSRSDRDQSGGLLPARADVPRRTRAPPPARALSDVVLSVPVARRRDRRHFCGPDRAAYLLLGRRISAADHPRRAVPPGPCMAARQARPRGAGPGGCGALSRS